DLLGVGGRVVGAQAVEGAPADVRRCVGEGRGERAIERRVGGHRADRARGTCAHEGPGVGGAAADQRGREARGRRGPPPGRPGAAEGPGGGGPPWAGASASASIAADRTRTSGSSIAATRSAPTAGTRPATSAACARTWKSSSLRSEARR